MELQSMPDAVQESTPGKQLSFETMDRMLDEYSKSQSGISPSWLERWSFWLGMLGAGVGMLLGVLVQGKSGFNLAVGGLIVEVTGFLVSLVLMVRREWQSLRYARRDLARTYDHDFAIYQRFVDALRQFPEQDRNRRLRYVRDRRKVMQHRMGLFTGGLERLGVIPVMLALYFQFKDWKWGDWGMLAEVNLVQGLLIWTLLLAYAGGWYLIRLHARTEAYELLLAEASEQCTEHCRDNP